MMKSNAVPKLRVAIGVAVLTALSISCTRESTLIESSGTIEATVVTVSSKVGGELIELSVGKGDVVSTGDLIAKIEREELELQLEQALAGVRLSEVQLELLRSGARSEDIEQAEAMLAQARKNLAQAEEDARRMRSLHETRSVTAKQLDDAEVRLASARAQYTQAEQSLRKLRNFARPEELEAARLRLEQSRISAALLSKRLEDAEIRTLTGGTVLDVLVERGELVPPGGSIARIADLTRLRLVIYVAEPDLAGIRIGQETEVGIDGHAGRIFPGRIVSIASEAEFTPKNVQTKDERVKLVYAVEISLDNPRGILKPGMPADATIVPINESDTTGDSSSVPSSGEREETRS